MMRLDKYLAEMGIGTRQEVKKKIRQGNISVNGTVVKAADTKIDENQDEIMANGQPVSYVSYEYYMLNKPAGVISATEDRKDTTVLDLIKDKKRKDLFPVGRLDKDTEGLLLITNDGELGHKLLSPKKHIDKEYYVECRDKLTEEAVKAFESGMVLKDGTVFAKAECTHIEDYSCHLVLHEGKYHEIKRMFLAVGNEVTYLKRIRMKNLILDETLKKGEYRLLTDEELNDLKKDEQE